jgi:hypothetical protein
MSNRRHPRSRPVVELRRTIDCLPLRTRVAMLEGINAGEPIIAGAYVDGQGGVCPMLAAHRRGGRTNFISFARAWDRFTQAGRKVRRASRRELEILAGQLQSSLSRETDVALGYAIEEHRRLARHSLVADADPAGEIRAAHLRECGRGEPSARPRRQGVPAEAPPQPAVAVAEDKAV